MTVTVAETWALAVPVGVGIAVSTGAWGAIGDGVTWTTFAVVLLAGAVEAALLGAAQAHLLRRWGVLAVRR